jgi:hypothetical protein
VAKKLLVEIKPIWRDFGRALSSAISTFEADIRSSQREKPRYGLAGLFIFFARALREKARIKEILRDIARVR